MKIQVLFLSVLLSSLVVLLVACLRAEPTPSRNFKIQDLLIDLSVMPTDWYVSNPLHPFPENRGQQESIEIQFDAKSPTLYGTQHLVFRYTTKSAATWEYQDQAQGEFGVALLVKPWHAPPELPYTSPIADQFRFECADVKFYDVQTNCVAMAQYDEYISIISTHMDPSLMTFADMGRILRAIDAKMAQYLGKPIPNTILQDATTTAFDTRNSLANAMTLH
ncbi:MAG: hypothetical protein WCF84_05135 [Anaerolineae bacterium]